jgi:hypothetical protein
MNPQILNVGKFLVDLKIERPKKGSAALGKVS